ncbi:hypothetical protein FACS1894152_7290 [Bacilli bacterium]|nr:hypothetical protein FACS1894152_7290 [Bacilli bacterium]
MLHIKRVSIKLGDHDGYAYIAMDHRRHSDEVYSFMKHTMEDSDSKITAEEIDREVKSKGVFILLSSEPIEVSEILPLYYSYSPYYY